MFLSLFPPSITVLPLSLAAMLSHRNRLIWKELLLLYKWLAVTKHHWEIPNIFPHRWIRKASYTCKNFHSYCNTVSPVSTIKNFTFSCLSATSSFALIFPVIIKPGHPYFTVSLCKTIPKLELHYHSWRIQTCMLPQQSKFFDWIQDTESKNDSWGKQI